MLKFKSIFHLFLLKNVYRNDCFSNQSAHQEGFISISFVALVSEHATKNYDFRSKNREKTRFWAPFWQPSLEPVGDAQGGHGGPDETKGSKRVFISLKKGSNRAPKGAPFRVIFDENR